MALFYFKNVDGKKVKTEHLPGKKFDFGGDESNKKILPPDMNAEASDPKPETPKPFIDRLTVNLHFDTADEAADAHATIYNALTKDGERYKSAKKASGFNLSRRMVLSGFEAEPFVNYSHKDGMAGTFRIEFNPARLGVEGLAAMHAELGLIIDGGWNTFIKRAHISRLDVAVDLPGVRLTKIGIAPPKSLASQTWSNAKGKLETYQWGNPKGTLTQIYNKSAQMAKKGTPLPGPQTMRVERRLRQPKCKTLLQLKNLPNAFAGIVFTTTIPPAPNVKPAAMWPLFCDSVQVRGLNAALQLLSPTLRQRFKKQFSDAAPEWWNPDAIWEQWPPALKQSRLTDLAAWQGAGPTPLLKDVSDPGSVSG